MNSDIPSLEELSLEVVADEFSTYANAYWWTTNYSLMRTLNSFKMTFSQRLLQELDRKGKLNEDHLDFLLNENVKELDLLTLLHLTSKKYVLKNVLPIAGGLTQLSGAVKYKIQASDCKFLFKKILFHAVNLRKICIPHFCDNDLLILIASTCSQLEELNISSSRVTDVGLRSLYIGSKNTIRIKCPLRYINLEGNRGIKYIGDLLDSIPSLEELIHPYLLNTLASKYAVKKHMKEIMGYENDEITKYKLTSLNFLNQNESMVSTILKICSEICPDTEKLSIKISKREQYALCSLFPKLNDVHFQVNSDYLDSSDYGLHIFLKVKGENLKSLSLNNSELFVPILVENCPNLETLKLYRVDFKNVDQPSKKRLMNLRYLQLELSFYYSSDSHKALISLITSSPNLISLNLSNFTLEESDIRILTETFLSCRLKDLGFKSSGIRVDTLKLFISNCRFLKNVSLINCLDKRDVVSLKQFIKDSNKKVEINADYDELYDDYDYDDNISSLDTDFPFGDYD